MSTDRERLERALDGQAQAGVSVLRGERPALLDGQGVRAILAPFMAAFMVAAAVLRMRIAQGPLDLLAVGLRTLALAFVVRALVEITRLARRYKADARASEHAVAYDDHGLLWRSPEGSQFVAKSAIAAVLTPPTRTPGAPRHRARPVWIARWPGFGAPCLTLPAYFAPDSEVLVARLARWLGEPTPPGTSEVSALSHAEIVQHAERDPGGAALSAVHSASHYAHRAPLGWLLAAIFALDAFRAAPPAWRDAVQLPLFAMVCASVAAPFVWWRLVARRTAGTRGIALVLTPSRALALTSGGSSVALEWSALTSAEASYRARWSPWTGAETVAQAELLGRDGTFLRYDGALIDTPVEVLVALANRLAAASHATSSAPPKS